MARAAVGAEGTMVLDWFGGKGGDVAELIARRKYTKAVDVLRERLRADVGDTHVRKQLADVLIMAGREREAVPVLIELADVYGSQGFAAKAIALLKKIEKLDPGRPDVDVKLASLIKVGGARPSGAWSPGKRVDNTGYEPSGASFSEEHFAPREEYSEKARIEAARNARWVPETGAPAEAGRPEEPAPQPWSAPPAAESEEVIEVTPEVDEEEETLSPELFRGAMLDAIQQALREPVAGSEPASAAPPREGPVESPLFSGFSQDELVAVMRGLRLLSFEPGDIILTQGDPGSSIFVLSTGVVKAFVKEATRRRQVLVRTMEEGEFFGEISILSGKPRTATITAVTHCELLELDRETLDNITKTYPRVIEVLEEFYIQRVSTQEEAMARNTRTGVASPADGPSAE
jgi:hypothetical protein